MTLVLFWTFCQSCPTWTNKLMCQWYWYCFAACVSIKNFKWTYLLLTTCPRSTWPLYEYVVVLTKRENFGLSRRLHISGKFLDRMKSFWLTLISRVGYLEVVHMTTSQVIVVQKTTCPWSIWRLYVVVLTKRDYFGWSKRLHISGQFMDIMKSYWLTLISRVDYLDVVYVMTR